MKLFQRVKFQRPDTGEICEGLIAWNGGAVQIVNTWRQVEGEIVGPVIVEVAQQGEDGIFRRPLDYPLDLLTRDVLRTLQKLAAIINGMEGTR